MINFNSLFFSPYVSGLRKYDEALEKGRQGEDCEIIYDRCQQYMNKLPKIFTGYWDFTF